MFLSATTEEQLITFPLRSSLYVTVSGTSMIFPVLLPSSVSSSLAVEQISVPVSSISFSCFTSFPSTHISSESRNATLSQTASFTPRFLDAATPKFLSFTIILIRGSFLYFWSTCSVSSSEQSSITMISTGTS